MDAQLQRESGLDEREVYELRTVDQGESCTAGACYNIGRISIQLRCPWSNGLYASPHEGKIKSGHAPVKISAAEAADLVYRHSEA